jgi:peptide/nickel transport system ATP-binding protein
MIAEVSGLEVGYPVSGRAAAGGPVVALSGVSVAVQEGEVLAVLGASGSGKTTLARVFARAAGELGADIRWTRFASARRPALIEQHSRESLHPLLRIATQLRDCLPAGADPQEVLAAVGLDRNAHGRRYPHQLSGGEAQRVAIARALALEADLIVADEITANLDVIATSRVLESIRRIVSERHVGCLIVTHDLDVCRAVADRVLVIEEGRVLEEGSTREVLTAPRAAFTRELVASAGERLL